MIDFPIVTPNYFESAGRLVLALFLGGVIGWERESKGRPAGLRTHMLVSLGAAGFTLVAVAILAGVTANNNEPRIDPIRILDAIIGGVGFLCAGAIIQSRGQIKGLTTAAGVWLVAAVGMTCGMGLYGYSIMLAVLGLGTLSFIRWWEKVAFDDDDEEIKENTEPDSSSR